MELEELIETLGTLVRGVDSSLLDEWERLKDGVPAPGEARAVRTVPEVWDVTRDPKQFTVLVRNELYRLLRALSSKNWDVAAQTVLSDLEGSDAPPTSAEQQVYEGLATEVNAQLKAWGQIMDVKVPTFNKGVHEADIPAVTMKPSTEPSLQ